MDSGSDVYHPLISKVKVDDLGDFGGQTTDRQENYVRNSREASRFDPLVGRILYTNAEIFGVYRPGQIRYGTEDEDMYQVGDRVCPSGTIGVRVRPLDCFMRHGKPAQDFTIRYPSEFKKIGDGKGRWYFFAWHTNDVIVQWIIIDLDKLRKTKLLEESNTGWNTDGGEFRWILKNSLYEWRCIVRDEQLWLHTP